MRADEIASYPREPESVADWEDLLVRLEIVPRVVRNAVEEAGDPGAAARHLAAAAAREQAVGAWLEAAAGLEGATDRPRERFDGDDQPEALALRFASLRARTFAMVQRRGLEVWGWEAPLEEGGRATAHQLLCWLALRDALLLSDLRGTAARPVGC